MEPGLKWWAGCEFVAFDFDGTLTNYVQADTAAVEALRRAAAPQADPAEFLERAISEILAFHVRVERGESQPLAMDTERLARTLAAYGVMLGPEHLALYSSALVQATVPLAGARELLAELGARGLRLALLTNAYDGEFQRCRIRACFPENPFEVIVVAGETEALKPDPRPFQVMLAALGLQVDQGVYVGDSPSHDVVGAASVGLRSVLVHAHPRIRENGQRLGADWTASALTELRSPGIGTDVLG